jgi:hypothetical protein
MSDLAWNPPRYLHGPHTVEVVATAISAVALLAFVLWSCRDWFRTGDAVGPFVILGGCIAAFQEPIVDSLGHIWVRSTMPAFTTFGRPMGVWAVLSYGGFFGLGTYLIYRTARGGGSRGDIRKVVWTLVAINLLIEPALIALHLYIYYGPQPLRIAQFPIHWAFINVSGMVVGSLVLLKQRHWFAGRRAPLGLALVPVAVAGSSVAAGLPVFSVLNGSGHVAGVVLWLGGVATILVSIAMLEGGTRAHVGTHSEVQPAAGAAELQPAPST